MSDNLQIKRSIGFASEFGVDNGPRWLVATKAVHPHLDTVGFQMFD